MGTPLRDHSAIHFTITTIKTETQCLTIPRAVGEGGGRVPSSNTCTVHLCVSDHTARNMQILPATLQACFLSQGWSHQLDR